jgi:tetratricopeptide (TPR) repeat protein
MSDISLHQAVSLHQAGRLDEAERIYRTVLAAEPRNFNALHLLGVACHNQGRAAEAIELIEAALRLDPAVADAHGNLGNALRSLGRLEAAEASYRTALRLGPDLAELHFGLGHVLRAQQRYDEAVAQYQESHRLRPDLPEAAIQLCNALEQQGQVDKAAALLRAMARRDPANAGAWVNLGVLLAQQRHFPAALECYHQALSIDPGLAVAHYNEARLHLLKGNLPLGWSKFEWRLPLGIAGSLPPGFTQPRWTGEDLGGGTLLLHAEQGFGDTIQFCRYVPLAAQRSRILLSVPQPLIRLLSSLSVVAEFVQPGQPMPHFDRYCSLMSLPHLFETELATIPADIPYLAADPERRETWRRRLAPLGGVRVGLVWAGRGGPTPPPADIRRSLALTSLAPLARVPGVSFVSLQKGDPASQAEHPPDGMMLHDFTRHIDDFADTADLIDRLDLVISVDTAVAHLAGALGKPVWLLNRFDPCWRWLLDRDDSPWYPSLRQFRQRQPGDWPEVVARVAAELSAFAAAKSG